MKRSMPLLLAVSLLVGLFTIAATTPGSGPMPQNLPRVLEAQRLLVAQEPDNAAAWNDLGNLLALAGMADPAEDAYRRATELDPDSAAYHYNLALLLQEADRLKRAAEQYRRVLELAPDHAWAHFQLGVIQEARGNRKQAVERYGEAFRIDPMLAFPDVNPHVIESDLITEAMLVGYRGGLVAPHAPRMYQEPGRLTYMLVRPQDAQAPPRAEEAGEARPPGTPATPPMTEPPPRRVLDTEGLEEGSVNQAAPQGRAGYRPPAQPPAAGRSPSTVRSWRPPTEGQEQERPDGRRESGEARPNQGGVVYGGAVGLPRGEESEAGEPPAARTVPRGRTPRGVGSTGSLEMILEPAQGAADSRLG